MQFRTGICAGILAVVSVSCVDHRPIRNGLRDESIYFDKSALTNPNPKLTGSQDDTWLYKVAIVKTSSPNAVGDYAFPGLESDTKLVRFRFSENSLQVMDARTLQYDDPKNPNDNLGTTTQRVEFEIAGTHLDAKLQESLDGERTNLLEENMELPWQQRQQFKVDFESVSQDPLRSVGWYYPDLMSDCVETVSKRLVPGSYEWNEAEQALNWTVEVNYALLLGSSYPCYDQLTWVNGASTASVQYHYSFYRQGPTGYTTEVIPEKSAVNKKYGFFQILNAYRDGNTGILSAKSLVQRWNPNRKDPVIFYFHPDFPAPFKPMFVGIRDELNGILEQSGASLRFDFKDHNHDGNIRNFGDLRYSFVVWHQDIDTTKGLLGYGPSSSDPRTGEVISANLNLYNVGMDYYRFLIQDYIEQHGGQLKPGDISTPWESIACTAGETLNPSKPDGTLDTSARLNSSLFNEMRRVMDIKNPRFHETDFVPVAQRESFGDDYHRLLGELRYVEPGYNAYMYHTSDLSSPEGYRETLRSENHFNKKLARLSMNENPFPELATSGRSSVNAQLKFAAEMRQWRKDHDRVEAQEELLLAKKNIYTFDAFDAISAITKSSRQCINGFWESDTAYSDRIVESVVAHVAIHELGHNVGLRHNFYGSVDAKHMEEGELSASVMDYVAAQDEAGTPVRWGNYDAAALRWLYGTQPVRQTEMAKSFLYCTDEHRSRSPLCTAHDLGVTPSQIVLNAIERYDWLYDIRNKRAFRTFWDTSDYIGRVYNALLPLQRMWKLAIFDWGGGGVQDTLKRLDQIDPERPVLSNQTYDAIAEDFYNDAEAAVGMTMAFYSAIVNQSASFRNYQTEFDPFYGDILRMGIIVDKLFATMAFMDLQDVSDYSPNIQTYAAMYDNPFTTKNTAIASRVLDDMLGANYDTFPWFKYYALGLFADATNSNMIDNIALKDRIAIRRYTSREELEEDFGPDIWNTLDTSHNESKIFIHHGEQWVYTFLPDRTWHLVANASRSPVSYQFIREYNESLNAEASISLDNYGLKTLLAYYEFFNNFVGF